MTVVAAPNAPHTPFVSVACARVRVLVITDSGSVHSVRVTANPAAVAVDVLPAVVAATPLTLSAPPTGPVVSTRTVDSTVAAVPTPFRAVRV